MPLDSTLVGLTSSEHHLEYDSARVILYALGVGAGRDELDYLYEGRGPRVLPTFAVVPAYPAVEELLVRSGGDLGGMVHGAQTVEVPAPLAPEGRLVTVARIDGVYDMKRLVQVVVSTETRAGSSLVARTEWQLLFREGGGFGGPRPPRAAPAATPEGAEPLFDETLRTSPEQALLYRLSGDRNPLHADPEFARKVGFAEGPILHGLATFGFTARAIARRAAGGDATRIRRLSAQFRKPVWPGDELRVVATQLHGIVHAKVYAVGRDEPVVTGVQAELAAAG